MEKIKVIKNEAKSIFKAGFLKHEVKIDDYFDERHRNKLYDYLEKILLRVSERYSYNLEPGELEKIREEIINEVFGFGIIDKLIRDPDITDILVNSPDQIYIEKEGLLEKTDLKFGDEEELYYILQRMVQESGRRIDVSTPYVDFRLEGGIRVTAVIPPIAADTPFFCIRKVYKEILTLDDLIKLGTLTPKLLEFLRYCIEARLNILVAGSTGAGKTTLMHLLIREFVNDDERLVLLEDTEEIVIEESQHFIKLVSRPANIEGKGEITLRDLVKLSLHLRPDRIIIGEVRGEEAFHFLHVINTGHEGSMCTVHASNPEDALNRLEVLALMDRSNITPAVIRRFLKLGIDLIIHMIRLPSGQRIISQVSEFEFDGDNCKVKDVFNSRKIFENDLEKADISLTGYVPTFFSKLKARTEIKDDFFHK